MAFLTSLGEVMLRLSPPRFDRLRTATSLDVRMCGAQFNLAADLAVLGNPTVFLSKLSANELGELARRSGTAYGVDMSHVKLVPGTRMGVIYAEFGAEPRAGVHIYDRKDSAASSIQPADFEWDRILQDSRFAHVDGIFPSLNDGCRRASLEFLAAARKAKCEITFDMNYRDSLSSADSACKLYRELLGYVDILVANQSVSKMLFGIDDTEEGFARRYRQEFGSRIVCMTSREMLGSRRGRWKSMAFSQDQVESGRGLEFEVVDRYGTGDAFFAGFLYGYAEKGVKYGLDFGNALCALAHTTDGDVINSSADEVLQILEGGTSFDIKR